MVQQEFVFDDADHHVEQKESFVWNSRTREFLGRDGASWAKISFFYAIFYTCLASFFVGMLAVFVSFMPRDVPTYFGETSTMSQRGLNPGLGFRPMVDVEDHLIHYDPVAIDNPVDGYLRYVRNLKNFLNAKYDSVEGETVNCKTNKTNEGDKSCSFDYKTIFKNTPCTEENSFGYQSNRPCVLVKLNKIISWQPAGNVVGIKCDGETSVDRDNLRQVIYHSEESLNSNVQGQLLGKYFPYYNQKGYRAPFVWVQFDIAPNTLVNIECRGVADNIDTSDRLNRRGMTKFSLFVGKSLSK